MVLFYMLSIVTDLLRTLTENKKPVVSCQTVVGCHGLIQNLNRKLRTENKKPVVGCRTVVGCHGLDRNVEPKTENREQKTCCQLSNSCRLSRT